MKNNFKTGKDLRKDSPRSPKEILGGFAILSRTIDKCRALLFGNIGDYHFDCPLDNQLFGFKQIKGDDFKTYVAHGHSDEDIATWVKSHGSVKTEAEVSEWNKMVMSNNYSDMPEKKTWLEGENERLGIEKDSTLFEYLVADDAASFKSGATTNTCEV